MVICQIARTQTGGEHAMGHVYTVVRPLIAFVFWLCELSVFVAQCNPTLNFWLGGRINL